MRQLIGILLCIAVSTAVWAQPDPNNPQPDVQRPRNVPAMPPIDRPQIMWGQLLQYTNDPRMTAMEVTPFGVFLLQQAMLCKLNAVTLQPIGVPLKLLGEMPELPQPANPPNPPANGKPADDAPFRNFVAGQPNAVQPVNQETIMKYVTEAIRRYAPPTMVVDGDYLDIILLDTYVRVNQRTMTVEAKSSLGGNNPQVMPAYNRPTTTARLVDGIIYVQRMPDFFSIEAQTGKVTHGKLPPDYQAFQPQQLMQLLQQAGGGMQPHGDAAQPGRADAQVITTVGTLTSRKDGEATVWSLKNDEGLNAALTGDIFTKWIAQKNPDGKRARVNGTLTHGAGQATLQVITIQVLD